MSTGNGARAPKVKRTIVLAPMLSDDGRIVVQREEAEQRLLDLLGTLWTVGGAVQIVADRIRVGTLPANDRSPAEPMGETVGLIIQYQANTPLNAESVTAQLEALIYEGDERADDEAAAAVSAVIPDDDEPEDDEPEQGQGD